MKRGRALELIEFQLPKGYCRARVLDRLMNPSDIETLPDFLSMVSIEVSLEQVKAWEPMQVAMAEEWAAQVHLKASDNAFIRVPPKPLFLPDEEAPFKLSTLNSQLI